MKKSILCAFLIMSSFAITSCQKEARTTAELEQFFNKNEIEDIELIVSFVEKKLLEHANSEDIDKAFEQFVQDNLENYFDKMDVFNFEEVAQLFDEIHRSTFENIWTYNNGYSTILKDSIKRINLAYEKKYMSYMELLGKNNLKLNEYINRFKNIGSYSASTPPVPPLITEYNFEKHIVEAPKEFGDYNTRVYRAVDIITMFHLMYDNKKLNTLHEQFRENLKKQNSDTTK